MLYFKIEFLLTPKPFKLFYIFFAYKGYNVKECQYSTCEIKTPNTMKSKR